MGSKDPFDVLGIPQNADAQMVRNAYRKLVKTCHPDLFLEKAEQKKAHDDFIALNLAYDEALKLVTIQRVGFNTMPTRDAMHSATRLMKQKNWEGALLQLKRAAHKDGSWYCMQGDIFMKLRKFEDAHTSYRKAIQFSPESQIYRNGALSAALAIKRSKTTVGKIKKFFTRK